MTLIEIMTDRRDGRITDEVAIDRLKEAGKTKAEAAEMLRMQDALFTNDVIEVPEDE